MKRLLVFFLSLAIALTTTLPVFAATSSAALEVGTYSGSYATDEGEGTGTSNDNGSRLDNESGATAKDALESYIATAGANHAKGTPMKEMDAEGYTGIKDIDLGLYLIVETRFLKM